MSEGRGHASLTNSTPAAPLSAAAPRYQVESSPPTPPVELPAQHAKGPDVGGGGQHALAHQLCSSGAGRGVAGGRDGQAAGRRRGAGGAGGGGAGGERGGCACRTCTCASKVGLGPGPGAPVSGVGANAPCPTRHSNSLETRWSQHGLPPAPPHKEWGGGSRGQTAAPIEFEREGWRTTTGSGPHAAELVPAALPPALPTKPHTPHPSPPTPPWWADLATCGCKCQRWRC